MPADEKPIQELIQSLRAVKTRPMFFAFVPQAAEGTLLLEKTKISPSHVDEAKKKHGGSVVFTGVCIWEDNQLVCELGHEPPATLAGQIKKSIKRDAELMMDVVTRFAKDRDGVVHIDPVDGAAKPNPVRPQEQAEEKKPLTKEEKEEKAKKEEKARQSERGEQEVHLLFRELSDKIKAALKGPNGHEIHEKFGMALASLLTAAQSEINKNDFAQARLKLDELQTLLGKTPGASSSPQDGSSLIKRLNEFAEPIKKLLEGPHKEHVAELIHGVEKAIHENDFDKAGQKLSELEGFVKQPPSGGITTQEWKKQFPLKESEGHVHLENYKVGKELGRGTTGYACLLEKPNSPPLVAKFLHQGQPPKFLTDEAAIYEKVGDHPNIPKSLGIVMVEEKEALALEAVEGDDWKKTLVNLQARRKSGELSQEEYWGAVQYMTAKTLQTLAHIEEQGLVHCDIKPDNLMIGKDGELKVIDLGGARPVGGFVHMSAPGYSPESEFERDDLTGMFDVFSVGVVASEFGAPQTKAETAFGEFCKWLKNTDPGDRPSAQKALADPFLASSLLDEEKARQILSGDIKVTPGFDHMAFDKTMAEAVKFKKIGADSSDAIAKASDLLSKLPDPKALDKFSSGGLATKLALMDRVLKLYDDFLGTLKELSGTATGATANYLAELQREANDRRKKVEASGQFVDPELAAALAANKGGSVPTPPPTLPAKPKPHVADAK